MTRVLALSLLLFTRNQSSSQSRVQQGSAVTVTTDPAEEPKALLHEEVERPVLLGLCKTEGHALERDDWAQKKLLDLPGPATDATEAEGVEPRLVKHSSKVPGRLTTQSLVIHPPADRNITWVLLTQVPPSRAGK